MELVVESRFEDNTTKVPTGWLVERSRKPHDQGGLCGMKFTPEQTFVVGETLNIQWKAQADFLTEP
jgi:hypothetical protein